MSATFYWDKVKAGQPLKHGTSSDREALEETFHHGTVGVSDVPTLRAMHRASGLKESLWSEIADLIESLPEGSLINVWVSY